MLAYSKRLFSSRMSIIGLFTTLVIPLTIPLVIYFSKTSQDIREKAAQPQPNLLPSSQEIGYISGYAFDDQNKNGERETGENGVKDIKIKITQINTNTNPKNSSDIISIVSTDNNGYFKYRFSGNLPNYTTFVIKLILPDGYKTVDINPVVLTQLRKDTQKILEFGIFSVTQQTAGGLAPGCYLQNRVCDIACPINNPNCCGTTTICPSPSPIKTCIPRPACLNSTLKCLLTQPAQGWCPNTITPTSSGPTLKGD